MPPRAFLLGNAVGLLPGAVLYPAIGAAALAPTSPTFLALAGLLVVAFVLSAWLARRTWRRHTR